VGTAASWSKGAGQGKNNHPATGKNVLTADVFPGEGIVSAE